VPAYRAASQADNTRLAYGKQWDAFAAWCVHKVFCDLPAAPETVALGRRRRAPMAFSDVPSWPG